MREVEKIPEPRRLRCNHHKVDDVRGDAQARQGEHGDEGALIGADEGQATIRMVTSAPHVEDHNTYRHGALIALGRVFSGSWFLRRRYRQARSP